MSWTKQITFFIVAALVITGVRVYIIRKHRNEPVPIHQQETRKLELDDMVAIPIFYTSDMESARRLNGSTVWVRAINQPDCVPASAHKPYHLTKGAKPEKLLPLEKLTIQDFILQPAKAGRDIVAIVQSDGAGHPCGVVAGVLRGADDYTFFLNEAFFSKDPHKIYDHWSEDAWKTIEAHQVKEGMTETQVAFSLGVGSPQGDDVGNRTIEYASAPKPVTVTFENNHVTHIAPLNQ